MKRIFILLFGTCVYLLSTASTAYANVENCIRHLEDQAQEIISALEGKGHYYTGICRTESPFLNVVVINLDNTKNEISITHSEKVDEKGYPLRRISKHAEQKGAHIAINGFTWKGATECPPDMSDAELFGMGHQCMHDRGAFVFNQGYASNPTGTVYSEGVKTYQRPDKNESSIGFAERTYEGTNAAFFDVVNMKEVKDDFTHNLDSTRSTIIRDGVAEDFKNCDNPANCNDATSSMGIGQYDDVDVLVLLSSHGLKVANYGDHAKIFKTLGVKDAIRLDGGSATSLYVDNKLVNALPFKKLPQFGESRHIMYALTVKESSPIVPESKIEFEDVRLDKWIDYGEPVPFSGEVISDKPISNIFLEMSKPDGTKIIDGPYYLEDNSKIINLARFSFGIDNYIDSTGRYRIKLGVEDTSGHFAEKNLSVEVLPIVTQVNLYPQPPFIDEASSLVVSGEKLNSDVTAKIGLKDDNCELSRRSDAELTFSCVAYEPEIYRIRVYYKYGQNEEYVLNDGHHRYVECNSGDTSIDPNPDSCGAIANGNSTRVRICSTIGQWGAYGTCTVSCNDGYRRSGNMCVPDTSSQVCTPNSTETKSCSITNGSGVNSRTCASDGESWGEYEGCKVTSCDTGYVIAGNSCVKEGPDETYEFYFTNARLDKTTVEAGKSVKASVTSNYSGNVRDGDMDSVSIGYYLSSDSKLDENDNSLGDDTSNLGSDDTSDNESADLIIPSTTASGEYYILFAINEDKKYPESDESNNVEFVKFEVTNESVEQYDFYIENARLDKTSAYPGDEVTASMEVHYSGNVLDADMNSVRSAYNLVALNANGETLYNKRIGEETSSLGSDDISHSESLRFNLPTNLDPGRYYVTFIADYGNEFIETNEDNNGDAVRIEVEGETVVPSIAGLDPSSPKVYPSGAFTRRTAYISGANFESGASVRMCWSTGCSTLNVGFKDDASYSEVESNTSIKIFFSPGDTLDNWNITVTNPDGEVSNTFEFSTSY